jgi:glycosyltransferase involved in cell wall biosynthesis
MISKVEASQASAVWGHPSSHGRPLRICHLAYTFYETDNRLQRYAKALIDRGDQVDVIALRRPEQPRTGDEGGVRVIRLQRRAKNEGAPWTYLAKILWFMVQSTLVLSARQLRRRYDIVHVHNVPDFLVFSALVPKLLGAKVILDIHDILPELYAGKFGAEDNSLVFRSLVKVERAACRFADRVIVANHLWHDRLIKRAAPQDKCITILNYPDLRIFHPRRERARRQNPFIVLYPGSLSRHQGLDVAITAFAAALDRMPGAEFHIYGEGPARSELNRLKHDLGLDAKVKLMDPIPVDQVAQIMSAANLGVEPKLARGFSNEALSTKILEFMASGVPVIVSCTLVHAHYFDENVVTFFRSGDVRELAAALIRAYEEPADGERLRRAEGFAAGYDWQQRAGDYYGLVDTLAAASAVRKAVGR